MAFVNFVKSKTRAEALAESTSNPNKLYFPTDADSLILNGKEYDGSSKIDKATASTLGLVKVPSANGLSIDSNGSISLSTATTSTAGAMSADDKTKLDGAVQNSADGASSLFSKVPVWSADPLDDTLLIRRSTGSDENYGKVRFDTVWNYIKSKISSVLGLTATNYGGTSANATHADSASNADKLNGNTADVFETKLRSTSRGTNLITNGNGLCGDNTNFSRFLYDPTVCNASVGSFTIQRGLFRFPELDDFIMVDPTKNTKFSFDLISQNNTGTMYGVLLMYDIDKIAISSSEIMWISGTTTYLTQDLKDGDTVVHLNDISNWIDSDATYQRRIIFWDYANSKGYIYPVETYSRHLSVAGLWTKGSGLDRTNNTITLMSPWNRGTVIAGTKLSQSSQGNTYSYFGIGANTVPTSWKTYSGVYNGTDYSGTNAEGKFRPGTAYVKLAFLWNYNSADDQIWLTNVSAYELHDATNADTVDGKHASDFFPTTGGTLSGHLGLAINQLGINFRGTHYGSWESWASHQNAGNEALVFGTQDANTTIMFANGESYTNIALDRFKQMVPGLQIQNNKVVINGSYVSSRSGGYNLEVNGTTKITSTLTLSQDTPSVLSYSNNAVTSKFVQNVKYAQGNNNSILEHLNLQFSLFDYKQGTRNKSILFRMFGYADWKLDDGGEIIERSANIGWFEDVEDIPTHYWNLLDGYAIAIHFDDEGYMNNEIIPLSGCMGDSEYIILAVNTGGILSYIHPSLCNVNNNCLRINMYEDSSGTMFASDAMYAKALYIFNNGGCISIHDEANVGSSADGYGVSNARLFLCGDGAIRCYYSRIGYASEKYCIIVPSGYDGGNYGY